MDEEFKKLVYGVIRKISAEGEVVSDAVKKNRQASENESRARLLADPRYGVW
jgi:hypothetical protein